MDAGEIRITKEQNGQDDTRRRYNAESAGEYIGQSRFVHREQEAKIKAQEDKKHARSSADKASPDCSASYLVFQL